MTSIRILTTLLLIACSAVTLAQQVPDDFSSSTAKGNMLISTSFSVNHRESENEALLLQNLDDSYNLDWFVTLRSGYFIKDNFAVGGYFKYTSKFKDVTYTNDGVVRDQRIERGYSIAPFIRNYLPLGNGRFSLFNETNLEFTYGSSVRQIDEMPDINRIVGSSNAIKLGVQPGITGFITNLVSFEVGTSLLGLSSERTSSVTNGDEDNKATTSANNVNFKIDLLSLFLGITFYFPAK